MNKILNIVVAGIESEKGWLLIQRRKGDYQEKWALVGGKMEFDETIKGAILREIYEETGLRVIWEGVRAIINERLKDKKTSETEKHFTIFLCSTRSDYEELRETDEGHLKWFSIDEIKKMVNKIIPSDYYMIKLLLEKNNVPKIVEVEMTESNRNLEIIKLEEY